MLEELHRRRLSDEKRDILEGPITKEELTKQLRKHMKPNSSPGLDAWLRHFWDDLTDLCVAAVNNCYEQNELTRLLKTSIIFYFF